jgi:cytosine/adenosine deaminase-related metal-dependent hydrolase
VLAACERTPAPWPWIVHAAEGVDAAAADDFDTLEALGCLRPNSLLVHGVALDARRRRRLVESGAALVWCPGSNQHLFGCTVAVEGLFGQGRLALGSDSRISGERDLLDELRVAADCSPLQDAALELLVTERNAQLLRCPDRGVLRPGACADFVVLPAGMSLAQARRSDLRLVVVGGQPRYADRDLGSAFDPPTFDDVRVDGRDKLLARRLVEMLREADIAEPGLELAAPA